MTHVLVVHHDVDMADQESDWLRQAGFAVDECAGPDYGACPVLAGQACPAVNAADVLVYDAWASGSGDAERQLIESLRETHPGVPMVITAPGLEFDWFEMRGEHAIVPLTGNLSAAALVDAVNRALATTVA